MTTLVDTDWREILSFSQRELRQADREKLCEDLSWMEVDDIELNFGDLKTLFRLSQDMLKFKTEQVNNLLGQLEKTKRKSNKAKVKETKTNDETSEAIKHQEELIITNKELLDQLHTDIAELERQKTKLEEKSSESESSRDPISEINEIAQLEEENALRNKHIRKLLNNVKDLEEENSKIKSKVTQLKDKLKEATQVIENLTEQLLTSDNERKKLKEILGTTEQRKAQLIIENDTLKKNINEIDLNKETLTKEIETKIHHWKNIARSKKAEISKLVEENTKLKEDLNILKPTTPKKLNAEDLKSKELQIQLAQATEEILQSANIIEKLNKENKQLKETIEKSNEYSLETETNRNESDEGKERIIINKLKRKLQHLAVAFKSSEEVREKDLIEITGQMEILKSDEAVKSIVTKLKSKQQLIEVKDEGIKCLVKETNALNEIVDVLQLENESLRRKLNILPKEQICTKGILKEYKDLKIINYNLNKQIKKLDCEIVHAKLEVHATKVKVSKLTKLIKALGHEDKLIKLQKNHEDYNNILVDNCNISLKSDTTNQMENENTDCVNTFKDDQDNILLAEENEGLRKGLQEILDFLKHSNSVTSGTLAVQCPSLEMVLQSMEMRHAAGWFAPHMSTVMELRSALGGRDALLTALHETRKETYDVVNQLSKESQRSLELEKKLNEIESQTKKEDDRSLSNIDLSEFGSWMRENEYSDINFFDKEELDSYFKKENLEYENQLKASLVYFHHKFKILFDKMTTLAVQAQDDQNNWHIQEERYKAEIESLKGHESVKSNSEDMSEHSDGLVCIPSTSFLLRKCSYLEESYKQIRTFNENIRNEYLKSKRDIMMKTSEYENQIQSLMLNIVNLTDKSRRKISNDLFFKQNEKLTDINFKYRTLLNKRAGTNEKTVELNKWLEINKNEIMSYIHQHITKNVQKVSEIKTLLSNMEETVYQKQLEAMCTEVDDRNKNIELLESKLLKLQENQTKIIDDMIATTTRDEFKMSNEQLQICRQENKILKEQCRHVESQLDIALLQLQDNQQRQINYDMETNMLRHQILDLQSTGDNKAIIARLSGEVLLAHLQASESHRKIETLSLALNKEKQLRFEVEEMIKTRQAIFNVYTSKYESKFRYMFDTMQALRLQYHGCLPITSIENYVRNIEDFYNKTKSVNESLDEIENIKSDLISKHTIYDQVIDISKNKCIEDQPKCPHELQLFVKQNTHLREISHLKHKLQISEKSQRELSKQCFELEKSLVFLNQTIDKSANDITIFKKKENADQFDIKVEDMQSDEEISSRRSLTITLSNPQILKLSEKDIEITDKVNPNLSGSPVRCPDLVNVYVQTTGDLNNKINTITQTDIDQRIEELKKEIINLKQNKCDLEKELEQAKLITQQKTDNIISLTTLKNNIEFQLQRMQEYSRKKDKDIDLLQETIQGLEKQVDHFYNMQTVEKNISTDADEEKYKQLLKTLRKLENEKDSITQEYKDLLRNEREEYAKSVKELNVKILQLQVEPEKFDEISSLNGAIVKESAEKYKVKIIELEDKHFKLQSELDNCKTELSTYHSEVDRWKSLATERLIKMEQIKSQFEERHLQEIESYKAENQHWMSQLNETQREHSDLRARLTEQKAIFIKQLADKDSHIEHLRCVINNFKSQIMNMQTLISVNDPSFDLSAIIEVDENSESLSQQGSDRLELKFESTVDVHEISEDNIVKIPATSTAIWQEPLIERLRREKQFVSKQNSILRRQIKALAAREKRSRLDAQNLKNQVFRISTSGNSRSTTAETTALHSKIASLQAQLTSARRDSHSTVALWDKCKRAQQSADRWQTRYEEKCIDIKKLEASLNLTKTTISRLEKEKRMLLTRVTETRGEHNLTAEKHDNEDREKRMESSSFHLDECVCGGANEQVLLERVAAQQRRIIALETAEKGNEVLVSEYEKSLAKITALKGQILKLESTLLESQIRNPIKITGDTDQELEYWKSYCAMLKDENMQLCVRASAGEVRASAGDAQAHGHQHRVNELEQTVLTLRGLVSKLQAEQKSSGIYRRVDSRPNSGRSGTEKSHNQLESYRVEIANLKRSILDKDLLLEKSKEMLKIAAEREDQLLGENASLRRRIDELSRPANGFLSA